MTPQLLALLAAQVAETTTSVGPDVAIPTWGWIGICTTLSTAVATLFALYRGARDREVEAEKSKTALALTVSDKHAETLERAIEVFTLHRTGTEQSTARIAELITEVRSLKEKVHELHLKVGG